MILYHKDTWFGSIRFFGSVLPRSVPQALASLLLCIALVYYAEAQAEFLEQAADSPLGDVGATVIYAFCSNPYVHQVSMLSISFVIAFRVNLAYARWWEGIGLLHNMRSKWVDAVVQLIAFDAVPPTDRSAAPLVPSAADFRVLIAHLFSLLHACAVLEVKKSWDVNCLVARKPKPAPAQAASGHFTACVVHFFPWSQDLLEKPRPRYEIIQAEVLGGISLIERQALLDMESSWVEHMHLRIVRVVCDRISNGGLNMDPPILSRIFQEISSGTLLCTGAQKISQVPFPFPFYELIRLIKWYFIVSNPFILVSFTTHPVIAGMMCFFSTLFFVAIIEVAEE